MTCNYFITIEDSEVNLNADKNFIIKPDDDLDIFLARISQYSFPNDTYNIFVYIAVHGFVKDQQAYLEIGKQGCRLIDFLYNINQYFHANTYVITACEVAGKSTFIDLVQYKETILYDVVTVGSGNRNILKATAHLLIGNIIQKVRSKDIKTSEDIFSDIGTFSYSSVHLYKKYNRVNNKIDNYKLKINSNSKLLGSYMDMVNTCNIFKYENGKDVLINRNDPAYNYVIQYCDNLIDNEKEYRFKVFLQTFLIHYINKCDFQALDWAFSNGIHPNIIRNNKIDGDTVEFTLTIDFLQNNLFLAEVYKTSLTKLFNKYNLLYP